MLKQISSKVFLNSFFVLSCLLIAASTFSIGYFVGESQGVRSVVPSGEGHVTSQGKFSKYLEGDIDFQNFWDIWNLVKDEFYRQPVSEKELYYGALKGVLSGTGDPYSVFFDPEEAEEFASVLDGTFIGIGAQIGIKNERLQVIAPLPNSPAQRALLFPGDWIVMIDGVDTIGMSVDEAVSHIRGEEGSEVVLTISKDVGETFEEVSITREKIVIDSVEWKIDENNIITISISTFNHDTTGLLGEAIQEALTSDVVGVILDLRNNPGGLLSTAVEVSSAWVGYDTVVIERSQDNAITYKGVMAARLKDVPTVVLVNGGSASASEIVSGALQDYGYGTLIGTQTFGKGSVQDYRELKDGSAVKITTAEWFTPKGRTIHEQGITPDIEIPFTVEDYKNDIDPQHNTAVQVILGTYDFEANTTEETDNAAQ